jgi:IS30 family transposase
MKRKTFKHLSKEERFVIEKLFVARVRLREIARFLLRSPNTVSRELNKNSVNGEYLANKADRRAYWKRYQSKKQCLKVAMDRFLCRFVERKLREKWSPEQISGYLKVEMKINCSTKCIYKFTKKRSLDHLLFWNWNNMKACRKKYVWKTVKDGRKYIDKRPALNGIGHFELDFIVSKQSNYSFLVAVDRLTRYTKIEKLSNRKRSTVMEALSKMFSGVTLSSITTDNDIAFVNWREIETLLNTQIYFTHPYHSWEKGLVENTNRWIRCFVPKRRDIESVTGEEIQEILSFLNNRPRKCIGFRLPSEYNSENQLSYFRG